MGNENDVRAMALWVEQHRGSDGSRYIAEQIGRMANRGDMEFVGLWRSVARHFEELGSGTART